MVFVLLKTNLKRTESRYKRGMKEEQCIKIGKSGCKFYYKDKEMTIFHREDGPAIEFASGHKEWYVNDKHHRTDGPAVEWANGAKFWFISGKLHRIDGPAIIRGNGTEEWFINGIRHRTDGPAVEFCNGYKAWYVNGKRLTEEEFKANGK